MSSNSSDDEEAVFQYSQPECIFVKSEPTDPDDANAHDKVNIEVDLLPEKSRESYWNVYDAFIKWKQEKNINVITERVMLDYFDELSYKYKPSSLWCKYSMLRSTIEVKHNVKLGNFKQLLAFLKENATGYEPKKSKVLTIENVKTFLNDAPDDIYLTTKVALIFGLFGGCRNCDLIKLSINDVIDHGQIIQVKLGDTKNKSTRTFIIEGQPLELVRIYISLRPKNPITNRFFLQYRNGRCTNQPLGKNKFGSMAKEIAEFLQLPDSELYSGHAFRRSSAALNADRDVTMIDLKSLNSLTPSRLKEEGCMMRTEKSKDLYYVKRRTRSFNKPISNDNAETSDMGENVVIEPELPDPLELQKEVECNEKASIPKEEVQRCVLHELEVMLSTVDAECTLEKLKKEKASFAKKLAEQLRNEVDNVIKNQAQITELMKNVELINTQIEKLEQKIQESNQENKEKTRWDFISTVSDAKEALNSLCEVMASNRKERSLLKNDLMEENENLKREKNNLQMQCKFYKDLLDNLSKRPKAKRKAVSSLLVDFF